MPIFKLQSNKKVANPEGFMKDASERLAEILGKPEKYIMVLWEESQMLFAGDPAPGLYAEIKSIGLPEDRTPEFSNALCTFLEERLGIPADRIYIEFTNSDRHLLGWDRKTF